MMQFKLSVDVLSRIQIEWAEDVSDEAKARAVAALEKRLAAPGPMVPVTKQGMGELEDIVRSSLLERGGG